MKILVLNSGSSSLKMQLIHMTDQQVLAKALIEKIGSKEAQVHFSAGQHTQQQVRAISDHKQGLQLLFDFLLDAQHGVVSNLDEIAVVGHRVVHGGEAFPHAVQIDEQVKEKIRQYATLAPLHNPANLLGIQACQEMMATTPQVAVFDTAFHSTLPAHSYLYGLPYEYYETYQIRRYGFHGTSHQYVSAKGAQLVGKPLESLKIISCHLGNGASIAAIDQGKVIDTSMGFTPMEGLMMGTRPGDFDPAVVLFLMEKEKMSLAQMEEVLNKKSGLLGVSGVSNDYRDIEQAIDQGNKRAFLANKIFVHKVKKYIGSYAALMNGVDMVIFTAGLGENGINVRKEICQNMDFLGIAIDDSKNNCRGKLVDISAPHAAVTTLVIPTNEEWMIAVQAQQIMQDK